MWRKVLRYTKADKNDSAIFFGGLFAIATLFLWGILGIYSEIEIDTSYRLIDGNVGRITSHFYIIRSAMVYYDANGTTTSNSVDYFFLNSGISVGDRIRIRVSKNDYNHIAIDQELGYRVIPQLLKLLLSLAFAVFFIPAYLRKINNYFLDHEIISSIPGADRKK